MSTFNGKIDEIPKISIDRFDGENFNSHIYFLSHCHTDHMRGLKDWAFQESLRNRPDVFLYASPISIKILKGYYPDLETKLKVLPLQAPSLIKYPYEDKTLTVTPLPAGHCPGSVMFLFETDKNILYTGDYRVKATDLKKYKAFYSLEQQKSISKIYLDTTFFKKSFATFPTREEALKIICSAIKEWVTRSKNHTIHIALSAWYGSEYLFLEIAKAVKMPIHVSSQTHRLYKHIPEMDGAVTTNKSCTQIHAGCGGNPKSMCQLNNSTRTIIPSALWWEGRDFSSGIVSVEEEQYRVCYSCHASFDEILDFLLFLKPKEIEPCVVPSNARQKETMMALLEEVKDIYQEKEEGEEFPTLKMDESVSSQSQAEIENSLEEESGSWDENLLASPDKNFTSRRSWLEGDQDNKANYKKIKLFFD